MRKWALVPPKADEALANSLKRSAEPESPGKQPAKFNPSKKEGEDRRRHHMAEEQDKGEPRHGGQK